MNFQAHPSDTGMNSHSLTVPTSATADRRPKASNPVSLIPRDSISTELEDAIREDFIRNCGQQMLRAINAWEAQGNFADYGEALFWLNEQTEAIKARSAAQVTRMEVERGLT